MKIMCAHINVKQAAFAENLQTANSCCANARKDNCDLVVLPEMFTGGFNYAKNKAFLLENKSYFEASLSKIAKNNSVAVCGSMPAIVNGDCVKNRLYFFDKKGDKLCTYDKMHLFSPFHEDKYISRGTAPVILNDFCGFNIGFAVCYDLRFPELFRQMAFAGANMFIVVAAWPHPRLEHFTTLCKARAIENQAYMVAVNQSGTENFGAKSAKYFGLSQIIDPWGEVCALAKQDTPDNVCAEVSPETATEVRKKIPSFKDAYFYKNFR